MTTLTFQPSEHADHVDVLCEGCAWNGVEGLADRFAILDGDTFESSVREYVQDAYMDAYPETTITPTRLEVKVSA